MLTTVLNQALYACKGLKTKFLDNYTNGYSYNQIRKPKYPLGSKAENL